MWTIWTEQQYMQQVFFLSSLNLSTEDSLFCRLIPMQISSKPYILPLQGFHQLSAKTLYESDQQLQRYSILRMDCIDTGAIAFMFNGGSSCASTIHPIDTSFEKRYKVFDGLDGVKGPQRAFMTHMNHEMQMHLCSLAPQVYLCSTSLSESFE